MAAYWVAHVNITDGAKFNEYMQKAPSVINQYNGELLVCGGQSENLEGQSYQQHVVIKFESLDQAKACYFSKEYQQIKQIRQGAGEVMVTLLDGMS